MKVFKHLTILLSVLLLFSLVVVGSVLLSLATTPNVLPYTLRQVWGDVSTYEPEEYLNIQDDIEVLKDLTYPSKYKENQFDVYYKKDQIEKTPLIIWVHGGAFISGNKEGTKVFASLVANESYTVISMNYEVAPEAHYPAPLIQVGELINHLKANKENYPYADLERIVIGGDSAGAHIAANFATIQANTELSKILGIEPVLTKEQLKGLLLYCGPYDFDQFDQMIKPYLRNQNQLIKQVLSFFVNQVGWSYFGSLSWNNDHNKKVTNVVDLVNQDFPITYITDGDSVSFMTHGKKLENKLKSLAIGVTAYYPSEVYAGKSFTHEYQFDFETYPEAARENLVKTLAFLEQVTK